MNDLTSANSISPASTPSQENVISEPVKSKSNSPFLAILRLIRAFFGVIWSVIKTFFLFFWGLNLAKKFIFIIILILVILISYIIGRSTGFSAGQQNIKDEVKQITGYEVYELDDLVLQLNELRAQLNNLR